MTDRYKRKQDSMSEKTTSRVLLNSDRPDAKLLLEKAKWASEHGGRFEIDNIYEDSNWYTKVTIWWPTNAEGSKT